MEVVQTEYLPWKPQYLVPIGDIQLGAGGVDISVLKDDIKRGLDNDAYFIGLGDYLDVASPSGRQKIKAAGFYDSVTEALNNESQRQLDMLYKLFEKTRGRWWGVLQGHHYYDFEDGSTTDTRFANYLDAPFLGDAAYVQARFRRKSTTITTNIFATHGTGSGQTMAAPLSKLERFAGGVRADLYLINHYARRGAVPVDVIDVSTLGNIISKTVHYMATGGYMKGYEQNSRKDGRAQGSYVEKAMMKPTAMGGGIVKFIPTRNKIGDKDVSTVRMEITV